MGNLNDCKSPFFLLQLGSERTHETCKPLKSSRDSDLRVDFDEDVLLRVNEDLQQAGFVERRIQECEEALVSFLC